MMLPILISVSLAPGSYFFSAYAAVAHRAAANAATARRLALRTGIVSSRLELFCGSVASRLASGKRRPPTFSAEPVSRLFRPRDDLDHFGFVIIRRNRLGARIGFDCRASDDWFTGKQAFGECHGIGGILVAKRRGEGRARKVPRSHSPGMADHLRAGGNAAFNCLQNQFHVEAGLLGNREPLGNARNLDCTHQIVDELVDRACSNGAEMPDRG